MSRSDQEAVHAIFVVLFAFLVLGLYWICYYWNKADKKEAAKRALSDVEKGANVPNVEVKERKCVVCLNAIDRPVLYLPCRHAVVCVDCDKVMENKDPCPVCRDDIKEKMEIFV